METDPGGEPNPARAHCVADEIAPDESIDHSTAQRSDTFATRNEIISQLEVDSNRSDNDSSLGSEITS
jgi:hypothetical protein